MFNIETVDVSKTISNIKYHIDFSNVLLMYLFQFY